MKTLLKTFVAAHFALGLMSAMADGTEADYYVSSNGSDANAGTVDAPFKTFTNALARAKAEGKHKIKILGMVKEYIGRVTLSDIEIYGDGWDTAGLIWISGPNSSSHNYNAFQLGANAFIHGLKLLGNRTPSGCVNITDGSAVVSNCWITGNWYTTAGSPSGVFSAGLVTHCLFTDSYNNNSGGPIMTLSGTAKMRNSVFTGNQIKSNARGPLKGVITLKDAAEMENCVVYTNRVVATSGGDAYAASNRERCCGGIYIPSGSPLLVNCIVRENKMPATPSDGLYPTKTGEDIYTPTVESDIYIVSGATPVIKNCNFPVGQVPAVAVGCQTGDPLFADPDNSTASSRDFHVAANSPCVNAGVLEDWMLAATDYSGATPRFQGFAADVGAYEKEEPVPVLTLTPSVELGYEAQTVTFTVGGNSTFPAGTAYSWTVDGSPYAGATAATAEIPLGIGEHTVSVLAFGHFNASASVTLRHTPGVMFTAVETQTNGYKLVDFTPQAVEMEFSDGAVYKWYWTDPSGAGAPDSTEQAPRGVKFYSGAHTVKLVVENADGAGASFSRIEENAVLVDPVDVSISVSRPVATGTAVPVTLAAAPVGFWFDGSAVYSWAATNAATGAGFSLASQNPVAAEFAPGTYDVYFSVASANGDGLGFSKRLSGAVAICEEEDLVVPGDPHKPLTADSIAQLNLKTINGQSVLGEGNIVVEGSASYVPYEDVKLHGAVGDGVADDSAAISAAVAAAKASGRPVYFPRPAVSYAAGETIVVDGVKVVADAKAALATTAGTAIRLTGRDASIENLVVTGAATGIEIDGATRALLRRVHVANPTGDGIAVTASRYVRVDNCVVSSPGGNALRFGEGVSQAVVGDSLFAGAKGAGVQVDAAVPGLVVETCQLDSNAYGVRGVASGTIRHNEFQATAAGVHLEGGGPVKVLGNGFHFFNGAAVPVVMDGVSGATVEDNCADTIRTGTDYKKMTAGFMTFNGCADAAIRGNVVHQNEQTGGNVNLTVRNSTNVTVRANAVFPGAVDVSTGNDNVVKSANFEM